MGNQVVRIGTARSIQYALRDTRRGLDDIPLYRVGADGKIAPLGVLIPVSPDGFVMRQTDGVTRHSDSLPWWLLAEHHALETLTAGGFLAARSRVIDHAGQRFLEVERFDRVGVAGRQAVFSLASVEAEFVGNASAPWPVIAGQLASGGHITREAADGAALLYAFGALIGNTDMHNGNLSFTTEDGRPYALAPAYDMLPMGFAPLSGGGLRGHLPPVNLHASVKSAVWGRALGLAADFLGRVRAEGRFAEGFRPCMDVLAGHIDDAGVKVARLG